MKKKSADLCCSWIDLYFFFTSLGTGEGRGKYPAAPGSPPGGEGSTPHLDEGNDLETKNLY